MRDPSCLPLCVCVRCEAAEQVSLQLLSLEQFLALNSPQSAVDASWMDINTGGFFCIWGKYIRRGRGMCKPSYRERHKLSVEELGLAITIT